MAVLQESGVARRTSTLRVNPFAFAAAAFLHLGFWPRQALCVALRFGAIDSDDVAFKLRELCCGHISGPRRWRTIK